MARQRLFTSYVADRFYNELFAAINDYAETNSDNLNLRLYKVNKIGGIELSGITVKFVSVNDLPGSEIEFEVAIDAEFDVREADYHYDTDEFTSQWFMLKCRGDLECGLDDFQITGISFLMVRIDNLSLCQMHWFRLSAKIIWRLLQPTF